MNAPRQTAIESAILEAAIASLRRHAKSIRDHAVKTGVSIVDDPFTLVRTSEAACALKIAASLDRLAADLADDLEAEGKR